MDWGAFTLLVLLVVYFIPALLANGKKNSGGIFFLNLFFGWTVIFWVVCFIWACVSPKLDDAYQDGFHNRMPPRDKYAHLPPDPDFGRARRAEPPVRTRGDIAAEAAVSRLQTEMRRGSGAPLRLARDSGGGE